MARPAIEAMLGPMDLETMAARLLTVGFHGKALTPDLERLIARGVGGVILFSRNVGSPREVLELTRALKAKAGRPLVVSIDQEGGKVARLREGFTPLPPFRALGERGDPALAHAYGRMVGTELAAVGIDLDFAPVLDVDTNPENPVIGARSLGHDPALVATLGVAFAAGLGDAGVAACGKHFPGHGDTHTDSHLELPRLTHPLSRLEQVELVPFAAAAAAGIPAIMTAHVVFEALDPARPATMSAAVLRALLRERLGYGGVVFSDDLEMEAIADHFEIEDVMVEGLEAGVDSFLACHTAELAHRAIDAVVAAVTRGALSPERVRASAARIQGLAGHFAVRHPGEQGLAVVGSEAHRALVERLGANARGAA
jgi:beta-N-acetylhexosaminidase